MPGLTNNPVRSFMAETAAAQVGTRPLLASERQLRTKFALQIGLIHEMLVTDLHTEAPEVLGFRVDQKSGFPVSPHCSASFR